MRPGRQIVCVFLPFVSGYFLTYVFRTINSVISQPLMSELALDAADLGLLTSVFFLSFAAAQLPLGYCLDRFGPRRVQIVLLPIAASGALLFATAEGFAALILGRVLIGIGVAAALMAELKAIVEWFPKERLPLANGCFVTIGALGAVAATAPAELLLASIGWRGLFEVLAILAVVSTLLIYLVVPDSPSLGATASETIRTATPKSIYADPRLWRLAPLSATCVGTSWSLQGLWGAFWLSDVDGLDQPLVTQHLFVMAVAVCGSALLLGIVADRLRRRVFPKTLLPMVALIFITAQLTLILRWNLPSYLVWAIIAGVGASTVLSFAILAEEFPKEIAGQANAALNVVHVTGAFLLQYSTGIVIHQWPSHDGHYPLIAYQTAFAICLSMQAVALGWYMRPERNIQFGWAKKYDTRYAEAEPSWVEQLAFTRRRVRKWRLMTAVASILAGFLGVLSVTTSGDARANLYATEVDRGREQYFFTGNPIRKMPPDAMIAYVLERFVINVRSLSTDPVIVRARWLEAYDFVTAHAAEVLSEEIRTRKPFADLGARPVIVEVSSIGERLAISSKFAGRRRLSRLTEKQKLSNSSAKSPLRSNSPTRLLCSQTPLASASIRSFGRERRKSPDQRRFAAAG